MLKLYFVLLILISTNVICATSIIVSGGTDNDIAGRMCRTADGRIVAIIERNPDWGSGDFFATFSDDEGATWSTLEPVVSQIGNQSSHSVLCANDTIYLYYASIESGNYKIYSIQSADGVNWNNKKLIDLGWASSQNVYDPIVIFEEDGSFTMSYVSMSNGAYAAHCSADGTWDKNKNQIKAGAYRVRICKHLDGTYMAAYHRNISGNYDIHVRTSTDLANWSAELDMTENGNSHDAYCSVSPDGIYYLYYAKNTFGIYNLCRQYSVDGLNWSIEEPITSDQTSNTQPSLFFDNNLLHVMWTHAIDYDTDNDVYYENSEYEIINETMDLSPSIELFAYSYNNNLVVNFQDAVHDKYEITICSMNGQIIANKVLPENESSIIFRNTPAGIYIIRAGSATSSTAIKAIVN